MFQKNEKGIALIAVILLITTLLLVGVVAMKTTVVDIKIAGNVKDSKKAFYIAEAGIGHGTEYLRQNLGNWAAYGTHQTILNNFPFVDGNYTVTIENGGGGRRRILSTSQTHTGVTAQIEVIFGPVYTPLSRYLFAVFGDESVRVTGNKNYVDSYDSTVGYISKGNGQNGDIGTNSTIAGAIDIGNGEIYGDTVVGQGGDPNNISSGPNGHVFGEKRALTEPLDMTPKTDPGGGINIPNITGAATLASGSYRLSQISLSGSGDELIINGNVTLLVTNIHLSGHGKITINAGGSLVIYCFGSIQNTGQGFFNTSELPRKLKIYGTATCTSVDVTGSSNFYGTIFAPRADVKVSGGGDFFGSAIGRIAEIKGGAGGAGGVHYDEELTDEDSITVISDIVFISKRNL